MNAHVGLVWAQDLGGVIGTRRNDLPWHLPEDLARFKELTAGGTVVMGRKTFESLPAGALPLRRNVVLSRSSDWEAPGVEVYPSLERALEECVGGTWLIGGGEALRAGLTVASEVMRTVVDTHVSASEAGARAPELGSEWVSDVLGEWFRSRGGLNVRFERWVRR